MMDLFTYTPVVRGFIVLLIAGLAFPIPGVYLLRMNLLPLRYMLMHGAILGGAVAMAFHFEIFSTTMIINLLLVWILSRLSRKLKTDSGYISTFILVAAVGFAFVFISRFNVPAKDTLELLWGSLYTTGKPELFGVIGLAGAIFLFQYLKQRELRAVFFDSELAQTSGVNERGLYYAVIFVVSITVGLAMKMIGALLIDALIILPALIATLHARSFAGVIKWASIWGGIFSLSGFFVSVWLKIPVSSAIALLAVVVFVVLYFGRSRN